MGAVVKGLVTLRVILLGRFLGVNGRGYAVWIKRVLEGRTRPVLPGQTFLGRDPVTHAHQTFVSSVSRQR